MPESYATPERLFLVVCRVPPAVARPERDVESRRRFSEGGSRTLRTNRIGENEIGDTRKRRHMPKWTGHNQPRVPVALGTAPMETEEGRALFQERLGVFAMWSSALGFAFYLVNLLLAYPRLTGAHSLIGAVRTRVAMFHFLGALVVGLVWWLTRLRPWSIGTLRALDVGGVIASCTFYGLMGFSLPQGASNAEMDLMGMFSSMLACTNVVLARAVIVPSSAARTVVVSLLALLPLELATAASTFGSAMTKGSALSMTVSMVSWAMVASVVGTVGSRVIYGLRRETANVKRLGQYTLEDKIGEGAMGIVYRASHIMLRRPTAIKLLPPERAGGENVERFEREVQLTAQLTHPNTVAVYDYGRTPEGVFYYAMEYLPGLDLEALVRQYGPQPAGRVIHILQQTCGALAEAHGSGLVHRDIKPANIILAERGGEPDVVKVVDFGVVKKLDLRGVETTRVSRAVLTGTPLYLSPEAIRSEDQIDGRSDIYSLGALTYFLLTAHPVFDAESVVEVCAHHLHSEPVPPSSRWPGGVPADLEAVVLTCLAKSPDDRFPDVRLLREALARCVDAGSWTRDAALTWWEQRRDSTRPRREPAVAAAAQTLTVDLVAR
jgi:eukaryotic-like serine/threonine-protein kinase